MSNTITYKSKCPKCNQECDWIKLYIPKLDKYIEIPNCDCIRKQDEIYRLKQQETEKHFLLQKSNIPEQSFNHTFNTFKFSNDEKEKKDQSYMFQMVRYYLNYYNNKSWLILWGNIGNGKTETVKILGRELINKYGIRLKYIQSAELIDQLKSGIKSEGLKANEIMNYYINLIDCIIIDELGSENNFDREKLFKLVNKYYDYKKPLIITSNLYLPDQSDHYLKLIWSRCNDKQMNNIQIPCDWKDIRKNQ